MLKKLVIINLSLSLLTVLGCAGRKAATVEQTCKQQTTQAEQQQREKISILDKKLNETITNLIIAAKVHKQHSQYVLCIDKTGRALSLLESTTKTEKN